MRLAVVTHRVAAALPADEKSGLAAALKRAANQPAVHVANADAAEEPDAALAGLAKCEAPLRELLTTALLAQQLHLLGRGHLRVLRRHVHRLRRLIDDEREVWRETQRTDEGENEEPTGPRRPDDAFDDFDDDAIGLTAPPTRRLWPLRRAA